MSLSEIVVAVMDFTFYYPLFMAYLWMAGSVYYFFYRERDARPPHDPPALAKTPGISFVVPCHNESENARETIQSLLEQDYPEFEVIAINDASTDDTGEILDAMAAEDNRVRVIHFGTNLGKAMGLRSGALASNFEFLICLDGDALLDRHASKWLIRHFIGSPGSEPSLETREFVIEPRFWERSRLGSSHPS